MKIDKDDEKAFKSYDGCLNLAGAVIKKANDDYIAYLLEMMKIDLKIEMKNSEENSTKKERDLLQLERDKKRVQGEIYSMLRWYDNKNSTFYIFGGPADLNPEYVKRFCKKEAEKLFENWKEGNPSVRRYYSRIIK